MSRQKAAICSSQAAAAFGNMCGVAERNELSEEQEAEVIACSERAIKELVAVTERIDNDDD